MNNPHYLKNDLWVKIQHKITQTEQDEQDFAQYCQQIQQVFTFWKEYLQRELEIIELESDAFHCPEQDKRRAIFKEMQALIQTNQELKKKLKKIQNELN